VSKDDAAALLETAEDCRRAQRAYFTSRSPWALQSAKEAERKLDKMIERLKAPPGLFDKGAQNETTL